MKTVVCVYVVGGVLLALGWRSARSQPVEEPPGTYKKMALEWVNRGSYNMSQCVNDLLNCWEVIRGDVICSHERYFETVCSEMRDYCHDVLGDYDSYLYWHEFTLRESVCRPPWLESYT